MAGNWKEPEFDFSERSDRVTLKLELDRLFIFRVRQILEMKIQTKRN